MAYAYTNLTDEQRVQAADAQITNFESERWNHELNLARLEAQDQSDKSVREAVAATKKAIATIDKAIDTTRAIKDSLDPPAALKASSGE